MYYLSRGIFISIYIIIYFSLIMISQEEHKQKPFCLLYNNENYDIPLPEKENKMQRKVFASDNQYWNERFYCGPLNSIVQAITVSGNDVYIGGSFTDAGLNPDADYLARWDGNDWYDVGAALNGTVYSITIDDEKIYIGGMFTNAGGNPDADYLAYWDGRSWHALEDGLNGVAYTIVIYNDNIYVGGNFTDARGNTAADHLARWDGSHWHALGTGLNEEVSVITVYNNDLYLGGYFNKSRGKNFYAFRYLA